MGRVKVGSKRYYEIEYKKLVKYCEKYNWKVTEKHNISDYVALDLKHIIINSRHTSRNKVFCLLHEIGHILVARSVHYDYIYESPNFSKNIKLEDRHADISTLDEEFAAWRKGLLLAKKRGIYINREEFEKEKIKCLMTYIKPVK